MKKQSLFDAVGGLATLNQVHNIFYDKLYAHPWLQGFFAGHKQEAIEKRQTAFMSEKMGAEKMGGPVEYWGKQPKMAHRHLYITAELFEIRHDLLRQSLQEAGVSSELTERWLKIDYAFKRHIVKDSIEAFYQTTWKYEKRVIIPKARRGKKDNTID